MQKTENAGEIHIDWQNDSYDCDCCGWNWADGAYITFPDGVIIDLEPQASCFGGDHWDSGEVFAHIFGHLGYAIEDSVLVYNYKPPENSRVIQVTEKSFGINNREYSVKFPDNSELHFLSCDQDKPEDFDIDQVYVKILNYLGYTVFH